MIRLSDVDYATQGLSIRRAFAKAAESAGLLPKPLRDPLSLRWGDHEIVTADILAVPQSGTVRLEFLKVDTTVRQGVDIQAQPGCEIYDGSRLPLLRTWYDLGLPSVVEYDFFAEDKLLRTCNVYEVVRSNLPNAERWTENAGMWIEELGRLDRTYHCSHGTPGSPADFDALAYRLSIV